MNNGAMRFLGELIRSCNRLRVGVWRRSKRNCMLSDPARRHQQAKCLGFLRQRGALACVY